MTRETRYLELCIRKAVVGLDDAYPLGHFIAHRLQMPLVGFTHEIDHVFREQRHTVARGVCLEIDGMRVLGDFRRDNSVGRLGYHRLMKALRTEPQRVNGAGDDEFYAAPGLEVGMEQTLVRFGGWPAVSPEELASMGATAQELAAASAPQCSETPSGLRRATPRLLDQLKYSAQTVAKNLKLPYRQTEHYVRDLALDLSRLTAGQRVVMGVIAIG